MADVSPIGLEEKVDGLNLPNAFICGDDKDIVEYERIRNGIRITNCDQRKTQDRRARRSVAFSERVHPTFLSVRAAGQWRNG